VFPILALLGLLQDGAEWTTYQHDAGRSGYSAARVPPPYEERWVWAEGDLYDGRAVPAPKTYLSRRLQPVTDGQRVFVGSLSDGCLYAIGLADGRTKWKYAAGAPFVEAATVAGGTVYAADVAGRVHAVDAAGGARRWVFEDPRGGSFMSCPAVAGGRVLVGSRSGYFLALEASTGRLLWELEAGAPVLNTPAVHDGSVYFGDEGMVAWRLALEDGRVRWKKRLHGFTLRHSAPVVVPRRGVVIWRSCPILNQDAGSLLDRAITLDPKDSRAQVSEAEMSKLLEEFRTGKEVPGGFRKAQEAARAFLRDHPEARTAFILRLEDGEEPVLAPFGYQARHADVCPEPVALPDGRVLGYYRGRWGAMVGVIFASKYMMDIGWLDIRTGFFERLGPYRSIDPAPFAIRGDDCARLSVGGDILFGSHNGFGWGSPRERGFGALDLSTMKSYPLGGPEARADKKDPLEKIGNPRVGNGASAVAVASDGTILLNFAGKAVVAVRSRASR